MTTMTVAAAIAFEALFERIRSYFMCGDAEIGHKYKPALYLS